MKTKVKYAIPIVCILLGSLFAGLSVANYEIYSPTKGPMSGFMPLVIGLLLILVGALDLFQCKKYEPAVFERDNWLFILCVFITIAASYLIGLLPASYLFAFYWIKIREKCTWRTTILTMVILLIMVAGIFVAWLDIPFSYGLIDTVLEQ